MGCFGSKPGEVSDVSKKITVDFQSERSQSRQDFHKGVN